MWCRTSLPAPEHAGGRASEHVALQFAHNAVELAAGHALDHDAENVA